MSCISISKQKYRGVKQQPTLVSILCGTIFALRLIIIYLSDCFRSYEQATGLIMVASIFSRILLAQISKEPSHFVFGAVLLAGLGLLQCVVCFPSYAVLRSVKILLALVQRSLDSNLCLE
jgi:hypothetical protein